jgi:Ca2+-binding EF-hand superfamily protein
MTEDDIDKIFKAVDTSDSGYIEFTEFVVASAKAQNLLSDQNLKSAFNMFD